MTARSKGDSEVIAKVTDSVMDMGPGPRAHEGPRAQNRARGTLGPPGPPQGPPGPPKGPPGPPKGPQAQNGVVGPVLEMDCCYSGEGGVGPVLEMDCCYFGEGRVGPVLEMDCCYSVAGAALDCCYFRM